MPQDWMMPRRSDRCAVCQREFSVGEVLIVFLYDAPTGYERRDCCATCAAPAEPAPVGSWKTRRADPRATAGRATMVIDKPALLSALEQLSDATDVRRLQFRFVLALLLWRKRALKLDGTRDEAGVEYWDFTDSLSNTTHAIARPDLDEAELERLSSELEALIAGGTSGELLSDPSVRAEAAQ